ncbi:MAG: hypothetical protein WAP03_20305 [Methylorubrum rhodinum]|uniref:hypothetical protein n=1 Tax=Methylorubrum rhodinum TaxID=29428 RepID=UPI003BB20CF0
MYNDLPEGAANHPLAPYNDKTPSYPVGRAREGLDAKRVISEAFDRMIAAGMKPVIETISGK